MAIPTYDILMLPVLKLSAERTWSMKDLIGQISDDLHLTDDERAETVASGTVPRIADRVQWAKTYLKQAGLVEQPARGLVQISATGKAVLAKNPDKIDVSLLRQFPEFESFLSKTKSISGVPTEAVAALPTTITSSTPEEEIEAASRTLDKALRGSLLLRILEAPPVFFERLILDLLIAMGYGGSSAEAAEHLGGTGDGGVDGVIREDHLGLDRVYLQAKRYQTGNTVSSETVQAFIGALIGKGTQKGVLITTSSFSTPARAVAAQSGQFRLVLIDGEELTKLMVRFGVGVRVARRVEIKRIDPEFFGSIETE